MSDSASELLGELPWALQRDAERYLASVRENVRHIFDDAHIEVTSQRVDEFLLLVLIQKIWAVVNTQSWILESSLALSGVGPAARMTGLRFGGSVYTRTSERYLELAVVRGQLDRLLDQLDIRTLVRRSNLIDLARSLRER